MTKYRFSPNSFLTISRTGSSSSTKRMVSKISLLFRSARPWRKVDEEAHGQYRKNQAARPRLDRHAGQADWRSCGRKGFAALGSGCAGKSVAAGQPHF